MTMDSLISLVKFRISVCVLTLAVMEFMAANVVTVCAVFLASIMEWLMTKRYHCKHPQRGVSTYSKKGKIKDADKYGIFRQGEAITHDRIAGKAIWGVRNRDGATSKVGIY